MMHSLIRFWLIDRSIELFGEVVANRMRIPDPDSD